MIVPMPCETSKGQKAFLFSFFLHKKISITLQRMQTSFILGQAITISLVTSGLPPLQDAANHHK
jgi:hypothetical protein